MPEEPRRSTLTIDPDYAVSAPSPQAPPPGTLPPQSFDPYAAPVMGPAGAPEPSSLWPGAFAAMGGDISNIAQATYAAGPGTLEQFATGQLQPGTPEAAEAARMTAMTYGLPGGAPGEALSAGIRIPREATKLRRPRTGPLAQEPPAAPMIGMGSEAPMFDPSLKPNVPQVNLTRAAPPPKGIPDYIEAAGDPKTLERVKGRVETGMKLGGEEWYNTEALRQGFVGELGQQEGQRAYEAYVKLLGPTSQQTRVPENIRNASYLYHLMRGGQGIPASGPLPHPYGMMEQTLGNARQVIESGFPLSQPKTASFTQNLMGNYEPYTWDRHISRLWDLRNRAGDIITRPDPQHYGYLEGIAQQQARQMGITPAAHQAGGWLDVEGVRSPREPFLATLEDRIRLTAARRGETPQQTYLRFLRGEEPLLQAGDISGMIGSGAAQAGQDQQQ